MTIYISICLNSSINTKMVFPWSHDSYQVYAWNYLQILLADMDIGLNFHLSIQVDQMRIFSIFKFNMMQTYILGDLWDMLGVIHGLLGVFFDLSRKHFTLHWLKWSGSRLQRFDPWPSRPAIVPLLPLANPYPSF